MRGKRLEDRDAKAFEHRGDHYRRRMRIECVALFGREMARQHNRRLKSVARDGLVDGRAIIDVWPTSGLTNQHKREGAPPTPATPQREGFDQRDKIYAALQH